MMRNTLCGISRREPVIYPGREPRGCDAFVEVTKVMLAPANYCILHQERVCLHPVKNLLVNTYNMNEFYLP